MSSPADLVTAYLETQRIHRQPKGVRTYGYTLGALLTFAEGRPLTPDLVEAWFISRSGRAPGTVLADMAAVGSFNAWWRRRDPAAPDLLALVERPRKPQSEPIQAPAAMVARAASWVESDDADPRSARFVALCLYAGLRISEARQLLWGSVDEGAMVITVAAATAKYRKSRDVPIAAPLARVLGSVRRDRRVGAVAGQLDGAMLSQGGAEHIFDRELPRFGIVLTAHMLRRAFATRLDELGVSVVVIQRLLGHASLATTQRYLGVERRRMHDALGLLDGAFTE